VFHFRLPRSPQSYNGKCLRFRYKDAGVPGPVMVVPASKLELARVLAPVHGADRSRRRVHLGLGWPDAALVDGFDRPVISTDEFALRHVTIHGHDVSYRRAGDGPVILLVHGIAGSSRAWRDVMPSLAEEYTVIAPDLIGHGNSAKPMGDYSLGAYASGMRDLLGVLGVHKATVVGQSFGGGVAMQLAYQHPECCERLVLVDSGGLGREVSWLLRAMTLPGSEFLMPIIFPSFVRRRGNDLSRMLAGRGAFMARVGEMWRAYASLTASDNRQSFVRTVIDPGGQTVSAMDRLYLAAHLPTLIVWGDRDNIIPVSHAYAAHEAIDGSRLEIIEGIGHFPHVEAPERFLEVLLHFLRTTDPRQLEPEDLQELLRQRAAVA
jgi:pimeloyl-ACP methyl ester carboxylesterase